MRMIAVVLPVYNGGDYLRLAVESVLNQSFQDFDFYIVDDCSSDGSWEYLNSLSDGRIKLFRNEKNKGLFFNLNFLIQAGASQLIKLWSQDDIMYPACLEKTIAFHLKYPDIGFSYSERDYIDEGGVMRARGAIDKTPELVSSRLHSRIAFYTGSIAGNIANVTIRRAVFNEVGLFREDMRISGDFDMWVRLARNHDVGFIKEPLIQLRDHKKQLSRQEKYFIFHLKEDIQVYRYLLSYVPAEDVKPGRQFLRNYKLLFYYTLMVKSLFKGRFTTFVLFFRSLAGFDNMTLLTICFLRVTFLKRNKHKLSFTDNSTIIESFS